MIQWSIYSAVALFFNTSWLGQFLFRVCLQLVSYLLIRALTANGLEVDLVVDGIASCTWLLMIEAPIYLNTKAKLELFM